MSSTLLSPKSNLIFKLIFAKNMDILIGFLKAVLNLNKDEYSHITVVDPSLKP